MRLIGHRGGAGLAPENTSEAIRAGFAAGADAAEVDLRLCADGAIVLIHDATVDRTTDGSGVVASMPLAVIRSLDAGARFRAGRGGNPFAGIGVRIPTLEEAWDAAEGRLVLEVKGAWGTDEALRTASVLCAFLDGRDATRAVASSFDIQALEAMRAAGARIATGVLTTAAFDAASNVAAAVDGGHEVCYLPDAVVDEAAIAAVHAAGKIAAVWTVNDPGRIRALRAAHADALLTDDPRAAAEALDDA